MKTKELIVPLYLNEHGAADSPDGLTPCAQPDAAELALDCDRAGADALLVFDLSQGDSAHDAVIGQIRQITRAVDIPVYGGGNIRRAEDVKKLLYAGCRRVFLNYAKESNAALTKEVSERFGREKILACVSGAAELEAAKQQEPWLGGLVLLHSQDTENIAFSDCPDAWELYVHCPAGQAGLTLSCGRVSGVFADEFRNADFPLMEQKHRLREAGIPVNTFEPDLSWEQVKTGADGLLPVVVQDYRTLEVLMVAYMNREAFEATVRSGRMTYWSRSRQELWVKGLTSGHFQYVKELRIDCDNDTLLAKVAQVGAACHTGNRSCFYRTVLKKEYDETNPIRVFEDVFAVILDRRLHPKEGSYTNYLFDKGIDKILKKVGEEATEIVIAAKNPDPEEIKYEISDFLYHVMVLMAERGVSWEDITEELARR